MWNYISVESYITDPLQRQSGPGLTGRKRVRPGHHILKYILNSEYNYTPASCVIITEIEIDRGEIGER